MGIGAVDDRTQLRLGGLRISGPSINLKPAMAATVLVEEAREEAEAEEEVGQRVLPVFFCRMLSGVVPSKSYQGRQMGTKRHNLCPMWMSVVFVLEMAGM